MKIKPIAILLSLLSSILVVPSLGTAGDSHLPQVEAEILQGWKRADGSHVSALRLSMQGGWKTYWRTPGDGGIPPRLDWAQSRNLAAISALWPAPTVFVEGGMTSYGYVDELILPLIVTPNNSSRDVTLKGQLQIGVCKDICVPVDLKVNGKLDLQETAVVSKIAAAMAERPYSPIEARVSDVTCRISPTKDGLSVSAVIDMPSTGGPEHAVIETGNPHLWVQEPKVSRSGGQLTVVSDVMHGEGKPFFLQRSDMTITVIGTDYAVEIESCQAG